MKFVTPNKVGVTELTITAKKTNMTTNRTIIQEVPAEEPIENIHLNVKFGKVQDGISYRTFMKK